MIHSPENVASVSTVDKLGNRVAPFNDPNRGTDHISHAIEDVPERTGINRSKIYAAIKNGHLTARKIGRSTIIEDGELRRWITTLPSRGRRQPAAV
jgi:excisionase family DNA binding protein